MKDVLGEERVLQPSKIELQNSCYWVHVMVILVPSQWIFPFVTSKEKQTRKIRIVERSTRLEGCTWAGEQDLCSTKLIPPTPTAPQASNVELAGVGGVFLTDSLLLQICHSLSGLQKKRCPLKELFPRENSLSDIIRFNDGAILKLKLYISIMWLKLPKLAYYLSNTQYNKWATTNRSIILDINCHQGFWLK